MGKTRLSEARIDTAPVTVRPMSYNVLGHQARLKAHCKRVQREYFDSGLFYDEMHQAQGGSVND